ncbi:MAG: CPBP family intramembrane metalloprotease [Armatimonadetes bacterium]|nr:CPBP family intramembrane metalloprotease [Armatimonadota bacterium]
MVTAKDSWKLVGLLFLCFLFAQAVLLYLVLSFGNKFNFDSLVLLNAMSLIFILLLPTVLFVIVRGWNLLDAFRLRPTSLSIIVITVLATFALSLTVSQLVLCIIQSLRDSVFVEQSKLKNFLYATSKVNSPTLIVLAVMLPALPEELVFRGVIQQGFERRYSPATAIVLTSIIFAFFHLDLIQAFSVLTIAIFWGWVVWRTQSILPTLLAHALQNALTIFSVISLMSANEGNSELNGVFDISPNWLVASLGFLLWLVLVLILLRIMPKRGDKDESAVVAIHPYQTGIANGGN